MGAIMVFSANSVLAEGRKKEYKPVSEAILAAARRLRDLQRGQGGAGA